MAEVSLSFISHQDIKENRDERVIQAKRMQTSIFTRFSAKRGAGRVERYFLKLRTQQINISVQLIAFVIVLILVVVHTYLNFSFFQQYFSSIVIDMATPVCYQTFLYAYNIFFEANYFSNMLSNFYSYPSVFSGTEDNTFNISQIEARALKSMVFDSGSFINSGFSTGKIISTEFVDFDKDKYRFYLSHPSDSSSSAHVCSWDAFGTKNNITYINSSFPNGNGDCYTDNYGDSLRRNWYQFGVGLNRSTWTNIYYALFKDNEEQPSISSVSPSHDSKGEITAVFSFDITLNRLSQILQYTLPGLNSRFAIISQQRVIVGVTGDDTPVDFYKGDIVTKTLPELRDPIWTPLLQKISEVTSSTILANYQLKNLSTSINTDSGELVFSIFVCNFSASDSFDWTFLGAICLTDMFDVSLRSPKVVYIEAILLLFIGWLLYFVFKCIYNHLINVEQNRLLTTKNRRQSRILNEFPIDQAVNSMKMLMMSHADNKEVLKNMSEVLRQLQHCKGSIYFSSHNFYNDIPNRQLRKKIMSIYGPDDYEPQDIKHKSDST